MNALLEAAITVFTWPTIGWIIAGILIGIIFGATPGIGATLGMALVLPFTIFLDGISAFVVLIGIYHGATYGGSLAAILINVPGTAASAASTFDGYPLTRQGAAKDALAISATASAVGAIVTVVLLIALSPIITEILLMFGTAESFLMALLGIALISVISKGAVIKGYIAGVFGLLITTIGIAPMAPTMRYTFDQLALSDGLDFIAILIGLFAISEMLILSSRKGAIADRDIKVAGSLKAGIRAVYTRPYLTVKSSLIGLGIGAVPGAGASVSNFFAYSEAMRTSNNPDEYGQGSREGLIAAESSNNGTVGGSIIPTIAFGIPGSSATAVLLGGLIMHGLRPGPSLFASDIHITFSMLLALIIGSFLILVLGLTVIIKLSFLTLIDSNKIIPIIVVLSVLGAYALRNNLVDVFTVMIIGCIGYYMVKHNYSIIAFTLGAVLGPIAEENLHTALRMADGAYIFISRPLSLLIITVTLLVLFTPFIEHYKNSKQTA